MNTLRKAMQDYLIMRRALGFKLHDAGVALQDFVSFLERKRRSHITSRLALQWAQRPTTVQPAHWARRLTFVRGFARYRSATDPRTEIPPLDLLPFRPKRARPYLYTEHELLLLLKASLNLSPTDALRRWTYHGLLGLLVVSGMRISEARSLRLSDVDLENAVLTIRGTKFGKSRLVPLHSSTQRVLSAYKLRRDEYLTGRPASDFFFVSKRGNRLDGAEVRRTFYALSRQTGLRGQSASHGPRLHDFRHRFAVQTLVGWYRSGQDVERRLPILSTYLGHVHVADTYWYLTTCPELMGLAVERLERHWGGQK
jgi:integrase/recombinase XerD